MDRGALLDRLTKDVIAYVMHGSVSEDVVVGSLKPDGLDERYDDYQTLVDIHFLLREDVVQFVRELPIHLRDLNTETRNHKQISTGGVEGRIDWQGTMQARATQSPGNTALFVSETKTEQYDTDENIVLKRLLSVLQSTLDDVEDYFQRDYAWVDESWRDEGLVEEVKNTVERNVHVRRIKEPEEYEPTDRMLDAAQQSRKPVYREAARLVEERRAIQRGDPDAVRELLESTAITPDDEETLLELYVLFRIIAALESMVSEDATINTLESGRQEVARFDGENEIAIYHDTSAGDRKLSFRTNVGPDDDATQGRADEVQVTAKEVANQYFRKKSFEDHTGRPDVIVVEVISGDSHEYLITEVKNSTRDDTIRAGIKETLEYLAFLRQDGEFVFDGEEHFGNGWNGLLVVQDLEETPTADLEEQETIRILQASEVESKLSTVFSELL